MGIKKL